MSYYNGAVKQMITNNYTNNYANINFKAKLNLASTGFSEYIQYMISCRNAPEGYFNSSKNIKLFKKICDAFEKHPSNEVISADVIYRKHELYNARGVLKSSKIAIKDVEPCRSDDGTGPMENILRKILDPKNKKIFNKLVGEEYKSSYKSWWNKNIKKIWADIKDIYFFDEDILPQITENQYNKNFRKQIDIADKVCYF